MFVVQQSPTVLDTPPLAEVLLGLDCEDHVAGEADSNDGHLVILTD